LYVTFVVTKMTPDDFPLTKPEMSCMYEVGDD
jgi:hypothetical protein